MTAECARKHNINISIENAYRRNNIVVVVVVVIVIVIVIVAHGNTQAASESASVVDFPRKTGRGNTVRAGRPPRRSAPGNDTVERARDRYPTDRISNSKSSTTAEHSRRRRRRLARLRPVRRKRRFFDIFFFSTLSLAADDRVTFSDRDRHHFRPYTTDARADKQQQQRQVGAMVLSDVNGNGKKSAAERWLRQRNGQRASAVRCIFGPPEKRAHLMVIMRNEAEMERKRIEFAARYEPVGMSPNERRNFYAGLVKSSSPNSPSPHHHYNTGKAKTFYSYHCCRTSFIRTRPTRKYGRRAIGATEHGRRRRRHGCAELRRRRAKRAGKIGGRPYYYYSRSSK